MVLLRVLTNGFSCLLLACVANPCAHAAAQHEVHVAPNGDDGSDGKQQTPFATPHRAMEALVQIAKESETAAVRVVFQAGVYEIDRALDLTRRHVPSRGSVSLEAADGATVLISGGRRLRGWTTNADGSWSVKLPEVAAGNWRFRELFVDGRRCPRARHPNGGYLRIDAAFPDKRSGFTFRAGDLPAGWRGSGELVFLHDWSTTRIRVKQVDREARRLTAADPIGNRADHYRIDHFEPHPRYFLENHADFLDAPGEWLLNEANGLLTYRPLANETPEAIVAVAPLATTLVTVRGDDGGLVRNVQIQGLHFAHCAWPLPAAGYSAGQATAHERRDGSPEQFARRFIPAAIRFELAEDCSFTRGRIAHLGTSGIEFGSRTRRCRLEDSVIEDVSGNGVNLGEDTMRRVGRAHWWQAAPHEAAAGHLVAHNRVERCGQQFFGAVGVWVGLAREMTIRNNEIARLPYTGVSLGWMWNPTPTPAGGHTVAGNHIHDVLQTLSDGGGIYTLGRQPGTRLSGNRIHNVRRNQGRAESNGMFLDQGSDQLQIEGNVIYDVDRSPLRFHQAEAITVRGNTLVLPDADTPPLRYNNTDARKIEQVQNTIVQRSEFDPASLPAIFVGPRPKSEP